MWLGEIALGCAMLHAHTQIGHLDLACFQSTLTTCSVDCIVSAFRVSTLENRPVSVRRPFWPYWPRLKMLNSPVSG